MNIFGDMKTLWIYYFWGVGGGGSSQNFRFFLKVKVQNGGKFFRLL